MRDELVKLIIQWMGKDGDVVFLTADIGGGIYKQLYKLFPERVFNVGIAEQNMVGMAAGLTRMGFRVICYSKTCFISLRVVDQIKNALCYSLNNAILIASDAGYDEANAGYPHISLEDIGVIQSLPDMDIYLPSTVWGIRRCFQKMQNSKHPSYLRMNKEKAEMQDEDFREVAEAVYYIKSAEQKKTLCVSYGCSVLEAVKIAEKGNDISVLAMDTLQFDRKVLVDELQKYSKVIVVEEQFENCGIYDVLCRLFVERKIWNVDLERIGPEFTYRKYCFDREYAWKMELESYHGGF